MKKLLIAALITVLAVMLVACGGGNKDKMDNGGSNVPPPPPPPPTTTGDTTGDATVVANTSADIVQAAPSSDDAIEVDVDPNGTIIFGEDYRDMAVTIDNVKCTAADKKLTFTLTNTDVQDWQLNQEVSFPPTPELVPLKVFISNYEVNGHITYYDHNTGEQYFGPNEKFSDNCGGIEVLKPGESATCTLQPVPLKTEELLQNKNHIFIDTPGVEKVYSFTCV